MAEGGGGIEEKLHLEERKLTIEDLQELCDNSVLRKLAKDLDNWQLVGYNLELTKSDIKAIQSDNTDEESRRIDMLYRWKEKQGSEATYLKLVEGFIDSERLDLVDQALDFLKEGKQK